ncbi:hypothetical protein T492DRAFT_915420, partial [Pavlovales sp. CCMP2436]
MAACRSARANATGPRCKSGYCLRSRRGHPCTPRPVPIWSRPRRQMQRCSRSACSSYGARRWGCAVAGVASARPLRVFRTPRFSSGNSSSRQGTPRTRAEPPLVGLSGAAHAGYCAVRASSLTTVSRRQSHHAWRSNVSLDDSEPDRPCLRLEVSGGAHQGVQGGEFCSPAARTTRTLCSRPAGLLTGLDR